MAGYLGVQPVPQAVQNRQTFTATEGQTSFATIGYTPQFIDVYLNGVKLVRNTDYDDSNGSDIVLTVGTSVDDVLEVVIYRTFETVDQNFTGDTTVENFDILGTVSGNAIRRFLAYQPNHYSRSERWKVKDNTTNRTVIVSPSMLPVNIGGTGYLSESSVELDLNIAANWDTTVGTDYTVAANRAGVDFYIYACVPSSGYAPDFLFSANSSAPDGYTTSNSRKIGGFHGLASDAGTLYSYSNDTGELALLDDVYVSHNITGPKHWLDGYVAGDPLPFSVWDLLHRPVSEPEGMVYDPATNKWVDIYLASWDSGAGKLVSQNGGTIADGASSPAFHQYKFSHFLGRIKKQLPRQDEFVQFSLGSPQGVNVTGSADQNTTGGHTATNGQRIVSLIGVEDATGVMWQWGREGGATNDVGAAYANAFDGNDKNVAGQHYEAPNRPIFGGNWNDGAICGSRGSNWSYAALGLSSGIGARGVAEPYSNE